MSSTASDRSSATQSPAHWVRDRRGIFLVTLIYCLAYCCTVLEISNITFDTVELSFREKWMPLLLLSIPLILLRMRLFVSMFPQINAGIWMMLGWIFLSSLWAPDTGYVLTQAVAISTVTVIGIAFSLNAWNPSRFAEVLAFISSLIVVASYLFGLIEPGRAIHVEDTVSLAGSWKGVAYQKNALGSAAILALILWSFFLFTRRFHWMLCAAGMLLSITMVLLSRSNSAMIISLIAITAMGVILRPKIQIGHFGRRLIYGGVLLGIPVIAYLVVATPVFEFVGDIFGKDGTFSGRVPIWSALLEEISRHPWIGIGFNSFWGMEDGAPLAELRYTVGWTTVTTGHNGYLDILNDLGIVGLAFLIIFLGIHAASLARLSELDTKQFALHFCIFLFIVLDNIPESGWFRAITQLHLIGMYSAIEVSRLLYQHRIQRYQMLLAPPDSVQGTVPDEPPVDHSLPSRVSGANGRRPLGAAHRASG